MSGWDHYADQQGSQRVRQQLHDQLRAVEAERDKALAENQRLREALEMFLEHHDAGCVGRPCAIEDVAREALAGDTG